MFIGGGEAGLSKNKKHSLSVPWRWVGGKSMGACLSLLEGTGSALSLDFGKLEMLVGVGFCSITDNGSGWTKVTSASSGWLPLAFLTLGPSIVSRPCGIAPSITPSFWTEWHPMGKRSTWPCRPTWRWEDPQLELPWTASPEQWESYNRKWGGKIWLIFVFLSPCTSWSYFIILC